MRRLSLTAVLTTVYLLIFTSCASSLGGSHSPGLKGESSRPINKKEEIMYKQAIIRCHKTGGTRIVKIKNALRCF